MAFKDEMDGFIDPDPIRALRLGCGYALVQAIGGLVGAAVSSDEIRELVEEAIQVSQKIALNVFATLSFAESSTPPEAEGKNSDSV